MPFGQPPMPQAASPGADIVISDVENVDEGNRSRHSSRIPKVLEYELVDLLKLDGIGEDGESGDMNARALSHLPEKRLTPLTGAKGWRN
jgi:hypothetical protein